MQPSQLDPVAAERLSHADQLFTSDLSVNEFALLHGAGFEPIELVMGVSVYHVGYQFTGIAAARTAGADRGDISGALECHVAHASRGRLARCRRHRRRSAGVARTGRAAEHLEFIAVGTAVRYTAKPGAYRSPNGQAFCSHLSRPGPVTLLRSGSRPGRVRDGQLRLPHRRAGLHADPEAGRAATSRCRNGPRATTRPASSRCPACRPKPSATAPTASSASVSRSRTTRGALHTVEFYAAGTAVRRIGNGETIVPSLVLPMSG